MAYKILSLDGGGVRGVLAARMLVHLEQQINQPLHEYFDLIAGTSTGAMLAAAIALGLPAHEIVQLYRNKAEIVFPYESGWNFQRLPLILRFGPWAPKFSEVGLVSVIKELLGDKKIGEIEKPKLLITSYDTIEREPIIFKSWKAKFAAVSLWEACVCSTSAPTFFPAHKLEVEGKIYSAIDGGLAANNPTACAVAAALRLGRQISELQVLSLGTGDPTREIPWESASKWGSIQWIWKGRVVKVMTDAPSDIYDYITQQVIGDDGRYLRLQFPLDRKLTNKRLSDDMDDASPENIANLIEAADAYMQLPEVSQSLARLLAIGQPQLTENN
ncbi:CBASS cGAMP-activated phospholipase [[Phormidium] sp. ETS-05]|uniref:CBASS cGAMP-activated phospholipase n=1 Tax=[Phormidium] sp. ETS-05 TaxID=222819 RepID=UPI0018EECFB6|nr:CBASS cGAMP-activated phospholipase [[Phormidium] sp. ETS-05]